MSLLARLDGGRDSAPADRARDRHQRIAVATAAGMASRGLSALALLIALPLAEGHLSRAELGVWSLLVSAVALLGFADLGLGNGLVNVLTEAVGRGDQVAARRAVTAAASGLALVSVVAAVVVSAAVVLGPWPGLFGVGAGEVHDLRPAIAVFAALVLVSVPGSIGQRIHLAYQQGWAAAVTNGVGSVLSLVGVVVVAAAGGGLTWFVAAMLGGQALAYLVETAWVLGHSHPDLRPTRAAFDQESLRRVVRAGGLFFVLSLAGAVAYQSDSLVISQHLGAAEVTRYLVGLRLFTLAPTALAALLMPLWPAYGEALGRGDHDWVSATLRRSVLVSLAVSGTSSLVLLFATRPLLDHWAGGTARPTTSLVAALACWGVVSAVSTALAMYFNGANIIRFQVVLALVMAVSNLALSFVLVRRIGIAGPVWASVATQVVVVVIPQLMVLRPRLQRTRPAPPATPSTEPAS